MSVTRKPYLFYLIDIPSEQCYYLNAGNVELMSFNDAVDTSLQKAPVGWDQITVKFGTNSHYFGLNRIFTEPFKFVADGAKIIRKLFYGSRGIEVPLGLVIFQWSPDDGAYHEFYSGALDLSNMVDIVNEGVQVNIMEGGASQFIKAWEKVNFSIPCDGSIPENVKIYFDGMYLPDNMHFQITPIEVPGDEGTIPASFTSEDVDSFGIVTNSPAFEDFISSPNPAQYFQNSSNYFIRTLYALKVRIRGNIVIRTFNSNHEAKISLFAATSNTVLTNPGPSNFLTRSWDLLTGQMQSAGVFFSFREIWSQTIFNFDITVDLQAGESLFLMMSNVVQAPYKAYIVGGSIDLSFVSKPQDITVWAISLRNAYKLLIQNINEASSGTDVTYNYRDVSALLDANPNLFITCGEAIRMAANPLFANFFKKPQTDATQPDINNYSNFGPSFKMNLSDHFDNTNCLLGAALGNKKEPGKAEAIYLEKKSTSVWNKNVITLDLTQFPGGGEVRDLSITPDQDYLFNQLQIGWKPQIYDQQAGKYEPNTTAKRRYPVKTLAKTLSLVSPWRSDAYGIQRLLAGFGDTSTTRNDADNDIFNVNVDLTKGEKDKYKASFLAGIQDTTIANNNNILLVPNVPQQPLSMPDELGGYFKQGNDAGIFVLSDPALAGTFMQLQMVVDDGVLNDINPIPGNPPASATIKFFLNGGNIFQQTVNVTGVNTPMGTPAAPLTFSISRNWSYRDCVYVTISTSVTGQVQNMACKLLMGVAGAYFTALGASIFADTGVFGQLIAMPTVTPSSVPFVIGTSKVQYGFQYFMYNDIIPNPSFNIQVLIQGLVQGNVSQEMAIDYYRNGLYKSSFTQNATNLQSSFPGPGVGFEFYEIADFQVGDFVFITGSCQNMSAWLTQMTLLAISQSVIAYRPKRVLYDYLGGIPNIVPSDQPGAAFNLEGYTPLDMLLANKDFIASSIWNLPGSLQFLSLDKNPYLSRVKNGVTYTEAANILISELGQPLFYPYTVKFKTRVPLTFTQIMTFAVNGHIKFSYNGISIYMFADSVSQKGALNEAQEWEGRLSPLTNLLDLIDMNIDGLKFLLMDSYNISTALISPLKWLPYSLATDPRYDNIGMDQALYKDRVKFWVDNSDFQQPWLNVDTIIPQLFSNGLNPVKIDILDCRGVIYQTYNMTQIVTSALQPPRTAFQVNIPLTDFPPGIYIAVATAGSGGNIARIRTEPFRVMSKYPVKTLFLQYSHTVNKQATLFSEGYRPGVRVEGWINYLRTDDVESSYADQTQDINIIDAIPYRVYQLNIGIQVGVPDYFMDLISRIILLDTLIINGIQYSKNSEAKWKQVVVDGQPKMLCTLEIREAKNNEAITVGIDGGLNSNIQVAASVDVAAFGQNNPPQNLLQVQLNNS